MRDPRVDRMAENIVNYSCKIVPGDKVMIESRVTITTIWSRR